MAFPSAQVVAESDMVRYHRAEQKFRIESSDKRCLGGLDSCWYKTPIAF